MTQLRSRSTARDLYEAAAKALIADGKATADMFDFDATATATPTAEFIDGITYDGTKPNAYIDSLPIGLKDGADRRRWRSGQLSDAPRCSAVDRHWHRNA